MAKKVDATPVGHILNRFTMEERVMSLATRVIANNLSSISPADLTKMRSLLRRLPEQAKDAGETLVAVRSTVLKVSIGQLIDLAQDAAAEASDFWLRVLPTERKKIKAGLSKHTRRAFSQKKQEFMLMHDAFRAERQKKVTLEHQLGEKSYSKERKSLSRQTEERFREATQRAPRFLAGKKKGSINRRKFERTILQKEFPHGINGRKFLGDGNYADQLLKEQKIS